MLTALICLGLVFLLLAIHPFVTYPLSLWLLARKKPFLRSPHVVSPAKPTVSICMSAFNEERVIVPKIESLIAMAHAYGPATIHVYVDGSHDRTAELLAPYSGQIDLIVSKERRGKTFGLNTLIERTSGELLMFTDANVMGNADILPTLAEPFADPTVGCATAYLEYNNSRESPTSALGALYWSMEEAIKKIESNTVGVIGVDGAMFMIRRHLYRAAPPNLIDDLYVSLNVLIQRSRIVSVRRATVEERSAVGSTEEFFRKKRIACQAMNVHRALWHELRHMQPLPLYAYISHRLIKWLVPFSLLLAGTFFFATAVIILGWLIPTAVVFGAALLLVLGHILHLKPASILVSSILSLSGVAVGVVQSLFTSRTYTVWDPAASVRASDE